MAYYRGMKVLILHAIQSQAGAHWEQWLHDELVTKGYEVIMPNLPNATHPDRQEWLSFITNLTKDIDLGKLIIVGHSLGVTSALDFIEQAPKPIKALVSVAGFSEDTHTELNSYFLREKSVDFGKVRANLGSAHVFYSDNDPYLTQEILRTLADGLRVEPVIIHNGGHLNTDTGFTKFPQVLQTILAI